MKKNLNKILYSKGYVSIETLIVAGLIISSGAFLVSKLAWKGKDISVSTNNTMDKVQQIEADNSFGDGSTTPGGDTSNPNTPDKPSVPEIDIKNLEYKETNDGVIITDYKPNYHDLIINPIDEGNNYKFIIPYSDLRFCYGRNISFSTKKPQITLYENSSVNISGTKNGDKYDYALQFMDLGYEQNGYLDDSPYLPGGWGFEHNDFKLTIPKSDFVGEFKLFKVEERMPELRIPNIINGKPVIGIGQKAFYGNNISKIIIPDSVKFIDDYAFNKSAVREVIIPNSVETIGKLAFANCYIENINIPEGVKSIGSRAFWYNDIKEIKIPTSVTNIGDYAFYGRGSKDGVYGDTSDIKQITMPKQFEGNKDKYFGTAKNRSTYPLKSNDIFNLI